MSKEGRREREREAGRQAGGQRIIIVAQKGLSLSFPLNRSTGGLASARMAGCLGPRAEGVSRADRCLNQRTEWGR